jgi:hypothetical protein
LADVCWLHLESSGLFRLAALARPALDFEAEEAEAGELAQAFADALDKPGWYVNFESPAESFVIFPGRIFGYPRGDEAGRAGAQAYGRKLAIPEPQLDWTV